MLLGLKLIYGLAIFLGILFKNLRIRLSMEGLIHKYMQDIWVLLKNITIYNDKPIYSYGKPNFGACVFWHLKFSIYL